MLKKILVLSFLMSICSVPCFAQDSGSDKYTIKEMTPEVQSALENRRARFDVLRTYKDNGWIGENRDGYLTALEDKEGVISLVEAENKDRLTIYLTIARQNNIETQIKTIQEVFAQVQRDKAEPGDMIQLPDGIWESK